VAFSSLAIRRSELQKSSVQTGHHTGAQIDIALGQQAKDGGVVDPLDCSQPRSSQRGDGERAGVVGVVLVRPTGAEHPVVRIAVLWAVLTAIAGWSFASYKRREPADSRIAPGSPSRPRSQ
jgi:hypothetical protein